MWPRILGCVQIALQLPEGAAVSISCADPPLLQHDGVRPDPYARTCFTTLPDTSVSRKARPWNL